MKSVLPKRAELIKQTQQYLADANSLIDRSLGEYKKSEDFAELYKTCLAANTVLQAMDSPTFRPSLQSLRTISLRIPLLMAAGQSSIVKVELRRYLELALWSIYFTHHPVEWQNFVGKRGTGFVRDPRRPISAAAHKELSSYMDYAREYMEIEPSGIALKALDNLEQDKRLLNAAVHAGEIARSPLQNIPIDNFLPRELKKTSALTKRVFGHSLLILAAFDRERFDSLPAGAKAYFDWIVGPTFQKKIRSGPFGMISVD
jgi:hypothetical protein